MVEIKVMLHESQHACLEDLSRETGRSLSELIWEAVESWHARSQAERVRALLGAFEDERGDVSERHDEYFADNI